MSDEHATALRFDWNFWARDSQLPPDGDWRIWLVLAGRGFGKTRIGAEWVRAQVREYEHVNLIAKSRDEYRDVMIEGESGILAICHPEERPEWIQTKRLLRWPNGAKTLCFTAEEPEQLRGPQHMRFWGDEVAKWPYMQEAFDQAMFGLRLGDDPRALLTTTPKPVPLLRQLVEEYQSGTGTIAITKGSSYENRDNLADDWFESLIRRYEGTRLGRQELEAELLLDEGLAYRLKDGVHVVPPFSVPEQWERFEGHDHGKTHACAWLSFATDHDGNYIAHAGYHQPGEVSDHAAAILKLRDRHGAGVCFADPSIRNKPGIRDWKGSEISVELSYNESGLYFAPGQNDRRAGYVQLSELLKMNPERAFPDWHPMRGQPGAPRLFVLDRPDLQPLIGQFRDAPLEDPEAPVSKHPGEAVEAEWEGRSGHAHAAARYALMSRPSPSKRVDLHPDARVQRLYDQWGRS